MFEEIKSLKDSSNSPSLPSSTRSFSLSYTKTNKLVTALYMVTDIMDRDEPVRTSLRSLGAGIISDIHALRTSIGFNLTVQIESKIESVLSFLEIASAVGMISNMNHSILKKEFLELEGSLKQSKQSSTLSEFFLEDSKGHQHASTYSKGHAPTRIGVQKGSTLMKALSDKASAMSNTKPQRNFLLSGPDFDTLKKERRYDIVNLIKSAPDGMTITDIKTKAAGILASLGEKTLQRELISMVRDNVLKKTGEKRWSKYFLAR